MNTVYWIFFSKNVKALIHIASIRIWSLHWLNLIKKAISSSLPRQFRNKLFSYAEQAVHFFIYRLFMHLDLQKLCGQNWNLDCEPWIKQEHNDGKPFVWHQIIAKVLVLQTECISIIFKTLGKNKLLNENLLLLGKTILPGEL